MFVLVCFVMALTSIVEPGDMFIYPKGLPCKVHNTTHLDCSYRELPTIPLLHDHQVNSLDLSHNQLSVNSWASFVNLSLLEDLHFSWNKIREATFNATLPLRVLNLSFQIVSRRRLWEIMSETYSGQQKLEILDLLVKAKKHDHPVRT